MGKKLDFLLLLQKISCLPFFSLKCSWPGLTMAISFVSLHVGRSGQGRRYHFTIFSHVSIKVSFSFHLDSLACEVCIHRVAGEREKPNFASRIFSPQSLNEMKEHFGRASEGRYLFFSACLAHPALCLSSYCRFTLHLLKSQQEFPNSIFVRLLKHPPQFLSALREGGKRIKKKGETSEPN